MMRGVPFCVFPFLQHKLTPHNLTADVSPRSVTSLDQFAATVSLVEHRLAGSVSVDFPVLSLRQIKRNELYRVATDENAPEDHEEGARSDY
jgi:hypothetical protein